MEVTPVLIIVGELCSDISHDIWNFSRHFKIVMYLFQDSLRNP